ncbi:hypothetical protein V7111_19355, partial [Neobacillus niacini]|uniref:hypothetical protein n=1 Tax=Neobacillus niacini TaxID=86668 RepID=UPI0030013B3E
EQYNELTDEIIELRTKKTILTNIILPHGDSPTTDEFKEQSGYNAIVQRIKDLEQKKYEADNTSRSKISFNIHIINEISNHI